MYCVYGKSGVHPLWSVIWRRSTVGRVCYRRFHCTCFSRVPSIIDIYVAMIESVIVLQLMN